MGAGYAEHGFPGEHVSPAPRVRTIFWDIGGVILTNGWDLHQRARVLAELGVDLKAYEAVHDSVNYYWERGLIRARDFFEQTVLRPNEKLGLTFDALWKLVCGESRVIHPECLAMLDALKASGSYRVATLNNESPELNEYRLDTFGLRERFDYFICSGYVHEMKPLPGIYRTAISTSGHCPEETLFIDDKQENCDAAVALGIRAIRFESPEGLRFALAQHGIHLA